MPRQYLVTSLSATASDTLLRGGRLTATALRPPRFRPTRDGPSVCPPPPPSFIRPLAFGTEHSTHAPAWASDHVHQLRGRESPERRVQLADEFSDPPTAVRGDRVAPEDVHDDGKRKDP